MWFKNIQIYTFTEPFSATSEAIHEQLQAQPFSPIGQMQESSSGWIPAFNDSDLLCETVNGRLFINAQIQEKILPASVVNDYLTEKLEEIEQRDGRRPAKKEREQLKEDIRALLLPKAFHKTKRVALWIDPKLGLLIVNAASEKTADDVTAQLRESIGSLPIVPFGKSAAGADILTQWFLEPSERPNSLSIESDLELALAQDPTVKARYKNLDLSAPEIAHSIESGMRIKQMGMVFDEHCQYVINEKFQLKRLKYQDGLVERAQDNDDPRTDAILMSDVVTQLIERIEPFVKETGI